MTGLSLLAAYLPYRYYQRTFKQRHEKLAAYITRISTIPCKKNHTIYKANSHGTEPYEKASQELYDSELNYIEDDEEKSKKMERTGVEVDTTLNKIRFTLVGSILSLSALVPMLHQFVPSRVEHHGTREEVSLKPGLNIIGNVMLVLGPNGKVLTVKETQQQATHKVLRFENLRSFLLTIAPFLSSLALCFFFFWYEGQEKNRHVQGLKNFIGGIFLLVSLWYSYWTLVPEDDPIPQKFYYIGAFLAMSIALIVSLFVNWYQARKLRKSEVRSDSMKNCLLEHYEKSQAAYEALFNPDKKTGVRPRDYDSSVLLEVRDMGAEELEKEERYRKAHYKAIDTMVKRIAYLREHHKDEYSEADIQDMFQALKDAHKEYMRHGWHLDWEPKELNLSDWEA